MVDEIRELDLLPVARPGATLTPLHRRLTDAQVAQVLASLSAILRRIPVLEYVRSTGRSVIEPQPYSDALEDALLELEGDTSNGDVVRGAAFWLAGGEGTAGSYSSNAGRRVLTAKLRGALPAIEVE